MPTVLTIQTGQTLLRVAVRHFAAVSVGLGYERLALAPCCLQ